MPSFSSLHTVGSGLFAQRRALEVIGQNIANASTAGYSRQEASFVTAEPAFVIGSAGRGISNVNVARYREEFVDRQYRGRSASLGYHDTRSTSLAQVEQMVGDLSEGGLRAALDNVFASWENLSRRPSDSGARTLVVSASEEFLNQANVAFGEMVQLRTGLDEKIQTKATEINNAAHELADLNQAILAGGQNQQQANELRDRRDMLIDSLAKLAGATAVQQSDGTVTVQLGSLPLVDRASSFPLNVTVALEADSDPNPAITSVMQNLATITWNGTSVAAPFSSGEMGALLEQRDQFVPTQMKYLDNLVRTVATEVNNLHKAGVTAPVTPLDIFDIQSNWMAIQVNPTVKANPSQILAGTGSSVTGSFVVAPGDGDRAKSIANLRSAAVLTGNPVGSQQVTPGEYLRTVSTLVGLEAQRATRESESASLQVDQADKQRQSISGVSLDEEMAKMIQFQQAYNAAARMMSAIDEMLDVVVNRLGTVGR